MGLQTYQEKMLTLLERQELMLAELYEAFAQTFPKHTEFWTGLAKEEQRHAQLIAKLREASQKGVVVFDEGKMKTYTLQAFIDNLEKILVRAKNKEISLASAFAFAVDFENSLIEKNVFANFNAITEKAQGVLKVLQAETLNHMDRIKKQRLATTAAR